MIISGAYIILNSADIAHSVHCNVANMDEIWIFILPRLISFKSFCYHLHSIRCGLRRFNSHYILLKRQFSEYFVNVLKKKKDWKHFQDSCENLKTLKRQYPDIQYVCRSP